MRFFWTTQYIFINVNSKFYGLVLPSAFLVGLGLTRWNKKRGWVLDVRWHPTRDAIATELQRCHWWCWKVDRDVFRPGYDSIVPYYQERSMSDDSDITRSAHKTAGQSGHGTGWAMPCPHARLKGSGVPLAGSQQVESEVKRRIGLCSRNSLAAMQQ